MDEAEKMWTQMDEAEKMWTRALVGYEKGLEPDLPAMLRVVQSLGVLYHSQGKTDEAEKKWTRALETILQEAAAVGEHDAVDLLLDQGVDMGLSIKTGQTSLHIAAQNGYVQVAKFLVKQSAELYRRDKDGWTPLSIAALAGQEEVTQVLLDNVADGRVEKEVYDSALQTAAMAGHARIVQQLFTQEHRSRNHRTMAQQRSSSPHSMVMWTSSTSSWTEVAGYTTPTGRGERCCT
ncbi:hypothetical protein LTR72_011993 [Exophiala xenobiotica]|nr:hypothetical protein LTR72_011993 [Exophiala xenobiotica]KAK5283155.1 hypothetical protein LTR14_011923 [Exophiala xenobiotica]KAK5460326.1 hypothetical protein LTR55_011931 [Exophiala xenobiotica]